MQVDEFVFQRELCMINISFYFDFFFKIKIERNPERAKRVRKNQIKLKTKLIFKVPIK